MTRRPHLIAIACALGACDAPPPTCSAPPDLGIRVTRVDEVDLLFVIDDSNSMLDEQAALAAELPRMMRILSSGDVDEDGDNLDDGDFDGVRDLNVGVITTDMGALGNALPTCDPPDFGDDGILRTRGRTDLTGCAATYPNILDYRAGGDPEAFARDVGCVASAGTEGCGVEQPLEAILKALTPTTRQPWTSDDFVPVGDRRAPAGLDAPFFRGASPHGNVANDGFARENSVLAILVLSDEDDCSAHEWELFDRTTTRYTEPLDLRCSSHPEALHPIERYVNGFLQLRARAGLLVFAPIVGVPPDLLPPDASPDWDVLTSPDCETPVRDPRLCEQVDPASPTMLVPSCNTGIHGTAMPPTRILAVARELAARGASVTPQSSCGESYAGAIDAIIAHVASGLGDCEGVPRELAVMPDGSVDCEVRVWLERGADCELDGYDAVRDEHGDALREGDRAVCTIRQLVPASREPGSTPPDGIGWYYDDFSLTGNRSCHLPAVERPRIVFAGAEPPTGSNSSIECAPPPSDAGAPCVPGGTACERLRGPLGATLACDPVTHRCAVPCESRRECDDAGLYDDVCDLRALLEIDPARFPGDTGERGFCTPTSCE